MLGPDILTALLKLICAFKMVNDSLKATCQSPGLEENSRYFCWKLAELEDRLLASYTCNNTCNLSSSSPKAGPQGKEKKSLFPHTLSPFWLHWCASEGLRPGGLDYTTQGFITSQDLKFTCKNKQKICNSLRKDVEGFLYGKVGQN